jgi:hypothetical protein
LRRPDRGAAIWVFELEDCDLGTMTLLADSLVDHFV